MNKQSDVVENLKIIGGITNELEAPIFQNNFRQGKEIL